MLPTIGDENKMVKIACMIKNGVVVGYGRHEDEDVAKNDAIRDYYLNGGSGLLWDKLWDLIDDGDEFEFTTQTTN